MKKLILCFLFLLAMFPALCQSYNSRYMTTRDGLASGYIREIIQDDKGFIWVSTNNGLSKYDGYQFTTYREDSGDPNSISGSYVWGFIPFGYDYYLVASNGGLDLFDPVSEAFTRVILNDDLPQIERAADIDLAEDGDVWVTATKGLYRFPDQAIDDILEAEFYPYFSDTSNVSGRPVTAFDSKRNTIWMVLNQSLVQFDISTKSLTTLDQLSNSVKEVIKSDVWEMHVTRDGTLLISALNGLLHWPIDAQSPTIIEVFNDYIKVDKRQPAFQSIWEDPNGNIYIGTGRSGAFIWNIETNAITPFQVTEEENNSLANNDVHYFMQDQDNNYWFGHHSEGLSLLYSNEWEYTFKKLFPEKPNDDLLNILNDVIDLGTGDLLFSVDGGLVYQSVNGQTEVYRYNDENISSYYDMVKINDYVLTSIVPRQSSDGRPLGGPYLLLFNLSTKTFDKVALPDSQNVIGYNAVLEDRVIFGSLSNRLVAVEKSDFSSRSLTISQNLFGSERADTLPRLTAIADRDVAGNVISLVADFSSPVTLDWRYFLYDQVSNTFKTIDIDNPENPSQFGRPAISHTREATVYITLGNGILEQRLIQGQSRILFQDDAGAMSEGNRYILEDNRGLLWMDNLTGLMQLDPETESVTYFEIKDDRRPSRFRRGRMTAENEIFWLGQGGYLRFKPDSLKKAEPISQIYISEVNSADESFNSLTYKKDPLVFSNSQNNLSFSYLALNYRDPLKTQYRYRIEGYDDQWINIGTQRRVFLANMPPGTYKFQVQAAGRNDGFSRVTDEIEFEILPPWWQTWWAYLLFAMLFLAGMMGIHKIQKEGTIRKERERAREKELAQAKEIEKAYAELKATQTQLIQSEKMASLGELTAGIAHEIQNPLNFVNNFSEVSNELIEEAKEEMAAENTGEVNAILDDLKDNLTKITHHGQRASGIVRSMLDHSRASGGEKVATDINALCDEYLRLAYHGMRAKDRSFNAAMETKFDESLPKLNVVPQDIGRVLLNLINNAFQATIDLTGLADHKNKTSKEHPASADKSYTSNLAGLKPQALSGKVTVTTKNLGDKIEITVSDNGPGIPDEIKDKIFQPFFTTKPTGKGTGLGLSLSYDIVKAHGGEIKVESKKEEGTSFYVTLPIYPKPI